jgi:RNA methyltransferase, TrmH family
LLHNQWNAPELVFQLLRLDIPCWILDIPSFLRLIFGQFRVKLDALTNMERNVRTELTSLQNPTIKRTYKLRDRRGREKSGLTLLEGYREITRAAEYGMELVECFYCPKMFLGENENAMLDQLEAAGVKLYECTEHVLLKLTYRDRPEGLIATAKIRNHTLDDIEFKQNGLYLVAEDIEKPGNLGSILRSADAAGVDALIICCKRTDIYNPNVIRASTGALFSVPLAETSTAEAIAWFRKHGVKTLSATPHTDLTYTDADMTGPIAIVVGAEQYGLSEEWLKEADTQVRIPMLGKIDSLNVATAATLLVYEAARQRNFN